MAIKPSAVIRGVPEGKIKVRRGLVWEGVKIKIGTKWWLLLHFLNLNTDLIVSKTKVKNSQNPIALVQDYYKIGILVM